MEEERNSPCDGYGDNGLIAALILLVSFGLVMGYSASGNTALSNGKAAFYFLLKQGVIGLGGFALALILSKLDYHVLWNLGYAGVGVSAVLLFILRFFEPINGARRWIRILGKFTFQPSELARLAIVICVPILAVKKRRAFGSLSDTILSLLPGTLLAAETLFISDDLSSAVILFAMSYFVVFIAHPGTRKLLAAAAAGVLAAAAFVLYVWMRYVPGDGSSFRLIRLLIWKNPAAYEGTNGEQTILGLYAIGNGGFFGKGLGSSTMKLGQLREAGNDWIFSVICEELGFFGAFVVVLLFLYLLYRLLVIAIHAPDLYGSLLTAGVFAHMALQSALHIAVTVGLAPPTGVTLPFFSFGGSSLLITMAEMAVVMSVSRRIRRKQEGD